MAVIPTSWKMEIEKIAVRGQPRQKVSKTPISTSKLGVVRQNSNSSYEGGIGRRIAVGS
jgi:hypothetical protein